MIPLLVVGCKEAHQENIYAKMWNIDDLKKRIDAGKESNETNHVSIYSTLNTHTIMFEISDNLKDLFLSNFEKTDEDIPWPNSKELPDYYYIDFYFKKENKNYSLIVLTKNNVIIGEGRNKKRLTAITNLINDFLLTKKNIEIINSVNSPFVLYFETDEEVKADPNTDPFAL